ncbi:MAG: hypothetical protein AAGF28_05455 [Pseudomonadota bacterium]
MPLSILVPMIVVGLAAVFAAVHFGGGSKASVPMDDQTARDRFLQDYPRETVSAVMLSNKGRLALLTLEQSDHLGIVYSFGQSFVTRLIAPPTVKSVSQRSDKAVEIRLRDFTLPRLRFESDDPAKIEQAMKTFERMEPIV